jgi:hypothetical protein
MPRPHPSLSRLRALCLALPEAEERTTWDTQTFRIRAKIFAMHVPARELGREPGDALWCKAPNGVQQLLIEADPDKFFRPPYVGSKGWIGVRLGPRTDWAEVEALVRRSWSMTAPRRIAGTLPGLETHEEPPNRG